jgi:pyridoxamine 5'-phosphate oxidase
MDLYAEALNRFRDLLEEARKTNLPEPTSTTLATTDASGHPTARTVLLKGLDNRGFTFFTNLNSRKGRQLHENPRAAMCFFWQYLMQQVVVEGLVELISDEEADAYWVTRERNSQLCAWASKQSSVLDSRETLSRRLAEFRERFMDRQIPRPRNWSGYRLVPERIEFWTAGWHRPHERVCYQKSLSGWSVTLLYP